MRRRAVLGDAVMVGRAGRLSLGRRCVCWLDVTWRLVFGRYNAVQWEALGMCLNAYVARG
jgi:hypothetical protein